MENGYMYYGTEAAAYMTAHGTGADMQQQQRWYRDEQCWNCDAPKKDKGRRLRLFGRTRAK